MMKVFGTSRGLMLEIIFFALVGTLHATFLAEGREADLQDPSHALYETATNIPWSGKFKPHPAKTIDRKLQDSAEDMARSWQEDDPDFGTYNEARNAQRLALATLYFATDGDQSWINSTYWLAYDVSECNWFSNLDPADVCQDDVYVKLDLSSNNLTGTLPAISFDALSAQMGNNSVMSLRGILLSNNLVSFDLNVHQYGEQLVDR
jgi:hypothetical protein